MGGELVPSDAEARHEASALDPYEAEYMGQDVAFRTRARADWKATAFAVVTSLFIAWSAVHGGLGAVLGGTLALGVLMLGVTFAVLRVTVSAECVDVHYGLWGPKIPIAAIRSVSVVRHEHTSPLRWGITPLGRGRWLYSVPGDAGRAVKIVWESAGGRRTHVLGSTAPERLAAAIETVRSEGATKALGSGGVDP